MTVLLGVILVLAAAGTLGCKSSKSQSPESGSSESAAATSSASATSGSGENAASSASSTAAADTASAASDDASSTASGEAAPAAEASSPSAAVSSGENSAPERVDRAGFDEATNRPFALGGLTFQIPSYYAEPTKNSNGTIVATGNDADYGQFFIAAAEAKANSAPDASKIDKAIENSIGSLVGAYQIADKTDVTIGSVSGRQIDATGKLEGYPTSCRAFGLYNDAASSFVLFACFNIENDECKYDYLPDFDRVIASATADKASEQTSQETADQGASDTGEVSPELKEMLDSYEAFMDEYIAFMQEYKSSNDITSMMTQYLDFLQRYTEFTQKIEAMDTDSMSTADAAYYVEVTARVTQKLLEAAV